MPPRKRKAANENVKSMFINLNAVIDQVRKDKGIPREVLVEAIESAMVTAARKKYGYNAELEAQYNEEMGEVELFQFRQVVEEVEDEDLEITLENAHKLDPEAQLGDELGEKLDSYQFGRIAAQTAKQVIIQKLREAESNIIYNEYKDRVGELINGIVRRFEKGDMIIDLGRTEALLPYPEQVHSETYKVGERIQAYFLELKQVSRGPQIILSRKRPDLVRALFTMEVPEINEGLVEIKNIAREAGGRSKVAVYSKDSDVDPVGACVGMKGNRVQSVVQELRGEKIDIVTWDEDPARFLCNAIAPAEVSKVIIHEKEHSMEIIVPDDQLSLAIGRKGQNVRLAAQLTKWNIDIFSETRHDEITKRAKQTLVIDLGIEDSLASILYSHAFRSTKKIAEGTVEELLSLPGINQELLAQIHQKAQQIESLPKEQRPSGLYFEEERKKAELEEAKPKFQEPVEISETNSEKLAEAVENLPEEPTLEIKE